MQQEKESSTFFNKVKEDPYRSVMEILTQHSEKFPWKERKIIPQKDKRILDIEIMGLPMSGKSTEFELIRDNPPEQIRLITSSEPQESERGQLREIGEKLGLEQENMIFEQSRLASFLEAVGERIKLIYQDTAAKRIGNPIITLSERGPHDAMTCLTWMSEYSYGKIETPAELKFEAGISWNPEYRLPPEYSEKYEEILFKALGIARMVDAVILFQVDYDEGTRRRVEQGLPPEGRLHNPTVRPQLEKAYGHWLSAWYPIFKEDSDLALLVVDGNKPIERNHSKVMDFINELL